MAVPSHRAWISRARVIGNGVDHGLNHFSRSKFDSFASAHGSGSLRRIEICRFVNPGVTSRSSKPGYTTSHGRNLFKLPEAMACVGKRGNDFEATGDSPVYPALRLRCHSPFGLARNDYPGSNEPRIWATSDSDRKFEPQLLFCIDGRMA
jgi:hypothetical protein